MRLAALLPSLVLLSSASAFPHRPLLSVSNATLEYMDPTLPPLLPGQTPSCSLLVLRQDFAHTVDAPPASTNYTPPSACPAPWSRIVLDISASVSGLQVDRVAAVWLDGAEILRTTTPFAISPGISWRIRKDVTRYTALLRSADSDSTLSMMLENSIAEFPGVFSVNVSLHFYRGAVSELDGPSSGESVVLGSAISAHPSIKGLYREPADLIVPISVETGECGSGFWFKIKNETDVQLTPLLIPNNTYRAVMEIYVSAHDDDQHWYANPLRSTGISDSSTKANGAFRQVVVTIDNRYVGAVVPFPVISPGSINPFFWAPVAAIGAYDHPSYDLDLTPFVGLLIDGRAHEYGLSVRESQPHWLVSANLHLWLDAWSDGVEGALIQYRVPPIRLSRQSSWRDGDGKSSVDGQVIIRFSGWVSSSKGNITTEVRQRLKFKSRVEVHGGGSITNAAMEVKARTNLKAEMNRKVIGRAAVETDAPLGIVTMRSNGGGGSVFQKTKMFHQLTETMTSAGAGKGDTVSSEMTDRQDSEGSVLMEGATAKWGSGDTVSTYRFKDDKACYLRTVNVIGGKVQNDVETTSCAAVADS